MSFSCTIHFKNIPPEKVYSFLQEYKSEVKKRADIICEKNFLWMPSIRNSHIYKDVKEHIINDIDINWVRGSLLTHRFFYLPEHQLLGIFGVPDGFKDMFDNISDFQDSCDQDYEFENWKGVPLFEKISNKWENASEDNILKSSKNSSEPLEDVDIEYYRRTLCCEEIWSYIKNFLFDDSSCVYFSVFGGYELSSVYEFIYKMKEYRQKWLDNLENDEKTKKRVEELKKAMGVKD